MNVKKSNKQNKALKGKRKTSFFSVILILVFVSVLFTGVTAARYIATTSNTSDGRVATFDTAAYISDTAGVRDYSFSVGVRKPGDSDSVYIKVDNSSVEVEIRAKIIVSTYGRLPLDYSLDCDGEILDATYDGNKVFWEMNLEPNSSLLSKITINWDASENGIGYAGITENIKITMECVQVG